MAKYNVGDKVKVGGRTATIVKILGTSASGEQMYGVKQDDNGWAYESLEGKMKAANAKFKVGDLVTDSYGMRLFEVTGIEPNGVYDIVDYENGTARYTMPEEKMKKASAALVKSFTNSVKSFNPIVQNAINACNSEYIPDGWKRAAKPGAFKKGDTVLLDRKIYKIVDDFKYSDEVTVQPIQGGRAELRDLLHAVRIVKNASTIASNSEVEITLRYASRAQSAMRDAVRAVSGAKISSTNTIECRSRDDAEEVVDILKMNAGIPDGEIWINSRPGKKVATNADTEASIDAEANKLYAQLKDIAKKFDALQSRLTKIHVYFTDYKATANGIRELHGMQ